jgi:hypothetical protein
VRPRVFANYGGAFRMGSIKPDSRRHDDEEEEEEEEENGKVKCDKPSGGKVSGRDRIRGSQEGLGGREGVRIRVCGCGGTFDRCGGRRMGGGRRMNKTEEWIKSNTNGVKL